MIAFRIPKSEKVLVCDIVGARRPTETMGEHPLWNTDRLVSDAAAGPERSHREPLSWGRRQWRLSVREREAGPSSKLSIGEKLSKPGMGTLQSL